MVVSFFCLLSVLGLLLNKTTTDHYVAQINIKMFYKNLLFHKNLRNCLLKISDI
jgi:abortive infection bacteriophage resistance protein